MIMRREVTTMKAVMVSTAIGVCACGTQPVASPKYKVRINELMSLNKPYIDENDTPDWIELYNLDAKSANLEGYYISDDVDTRFIQVLPAEAIVPGFGVLLLWADGLPGRGPLHMNFTLSSSGEGVWLSNPQGYVVDSIEFGNIPPNDAGAYGGQTLETTLARFPDGTGPFQWCSVFTPNEVNGDHCGGKPL